MNEIKLDFVKILASLFEKYKEQSWVLSKEDLEKASKSFFGNSKFKSGLVKHVISLKEEKYLIGLKSGVIFDQWCLLFIGDRKESTGYEVVSIDLKVFTEKTFTGITLAEFKSKIMINGSSLEIIQYPDIQKKGIMLSLDKTELDFFTELFDLCELEAKIQLNQKIEILGQEKTKFKLTQTSIISEFDNDNNGVIDLISNDFYKILSLNQKQIVEIGDKYIHHFIKVSNYIDNKGNNLQTIFQSVSTTENLDELDKRIALLRNQVHAYESLVFHSINMITSIVSRDLISFYEIYETFDKLGIFNSTWENEISEKLKNIDNKLDDIMNSINDMEYNIIRELNGLRYFTMESFKELDRSVKNSLKSIESSLDVNNLLSGIQAYQ